MNEATRSPEPSETLLISLVIPVYNEEAAIPLFFEELEQHKVGWPFRTDILFVDDGSSDNSLEQIRLLASRHERVHFISFSRNFGKEIALSAGLDYATGDAVVMMDVDLQHPLETVPQFVKEWQDNGTKMVYGVRNQDNDETRLKRSTSRLFYRLFNKLAHTTLPEGGGDFRLLDRDVVAALKALPERNRFMKGLYSWVGFSTKAIPYQQPTRSVGESRFNYWKLWNFALDGLVSFTTWPLRVWSYIGGLVALCAFIYGGYVVIKTMIWGVELPGYASLMAGVMFLGGIQLISIGILGEYLSRLFAESKQRPLYMIQDKRIPHAAE
jgi:glycosyltransferase involved in cell wall biosynthesis